MEAGPSLAASATPTATRQKNQQRENRQNEELLALDNVRTLPHTGFQARSRKSDQQLPKAASEQIANSQGGNQAMAEKSEISRRRLIEGGLAGAALLSAPAYLRSSALAAGEPIKIGMPIGI